MTTKRRRPKKPSDKKLSHAKAVALRVMRDRALAPMSATFLDPKDGKTYVNPVSGKKPKGQQRSPRSFIDVVLLEVAAELKTNKKTLEHDYYEKRDELDKSLVKELANKITERLQARDRVKDQKRKIVANQKLAKVFRKK